MLNTTAMNDSIAVAIIESAPTALSAFQTTGDDTEDGVRRRSMRCVTIAARIAPAKKRAGISQKAPAAFSRSLTSGKTR